MQPWAFHRLLALEAGHWCFDYATFHFNVMLNTPSSVVDSATRTSNLFYNVNAPAWCLSRTLMTSYTSGNGNNHCPPPGHSDNPLQIGESQVDGLWSSEKHSPWGGKPRTRGMCAPVSPRCQSKSYVGHAILEASTGEPHLSPSVF